MLDLAVHVKRDSAFLGTRHTLSIEAELADRDSAIPVSSFLEHLFRISPEFVPSICFQSSENSQPVLLEDLRGRPADAFPEQERSALETLRRAQEEELFFTDGVIINTENSDENDSAADETPFFLRISSKFETFKGSRHIMYRVRHSGTPALDEMRPFLSGRLLARLLPLRLEKIRLGLENYRGRTFGAMFGIVPSVQDRLYLEVTRSSIQLRSSCEYSSRKSKLPFSDQNLLSHLDLALRDSKLFPNFFERLAASI